VIRETCPCGATLVITDDATATRVLRAWRNQHYGHRSPTTALGWGFAGDGSDPITTTTTTTTEVRGQ